MINTVFLYVLLGVIVFYALEWAVVGSGFKVLIGGAFGLLLYIAIYLSKNQKIMSDMEESNDRQ
ncbi:hypothetical protein FC682_26000 [Peribacillus simplex]|uniref:Uncharacterized protein n=1 Tax=Peribacillus simplex TaxID=1478 RepID=A0A9X8ZCK1_9BACI|nr:hypothetical protein [Peribacillus simplex]TKG98927.1 hypothetical protein FC682_26000 [Peribacillus simplex]TKH03780.1 hypothetical protein FC678_24935 [Peribacillus simplex]